MTKINFREIIKNASNNPAETRISEALIGADPRDLSKEFNTPVNEINMAFSEWSQEDLSKMVGRECFVVCTLKDCDSGNLLQLKRGKLTDTGMGDTVKVDNKIYMDAMTHATFEGALKTVLLAVKMKLDI